MARPIPPDPSDPGREPDDGLNGFVVVALNDVAEPLVRDDLLAVAAAAGLTALASFLRDAAAPRTALVIPPDQRERTARLEEAARRNNPERRRHSMLLFWRIDAGTTPLRPQELARALIALPGVHTAYAEDRVSDTSSRPCPAVAARAAVTHRDPAPDGVGAAAGREHAGGDGTGVRFVDLEQGWRLTHPALAGRPQLLPDADRVNRDGVGPFVGDHGTAVLGIVLGVDPGQGVEGLAPGLEVAAAASHYDGHLGKPLHVEAAIVQAVDALTADAREGSVLLLEVQRGPETKQLPTETQYLDLQAITTAVDNHVVVVEVAGNGDEDLDSWKGANPSRRMERGHVDFDSGAIVVGACLAATTDGGHTRIAGSNWGARVDCYAWGERVRSATATGYADFSATSAAGAIVAGVAAVVQGAVQAAGRPPLRPDAMRALLSRADLGTPQVEPGRAKRIGSMPDLARVLPAALAGGPS